MHIREFRIEDAVGACQVLRRSIVELCTADHRNDAVIQDRWLKNKTPASVASWISQPNSHVFVAVDDEGAILAIGAVTSAGEITLNYVSPDARFQGISRALLERLEVRAQELGNFVCTLTSTGTARRFYLSSGYVVQEVRQSIFGAFPTFLMTKQLSQAEAESSGDQETL
jgi:GNAT superfamily N-acetyltransferase